MKHFGFIKSVAFLLLFLLLAPSVFAGRQWAPGLDGKQRKRGEGGKSCLWLKFGPSIGSINYEFGGNATMLGIMTEFGVRAYQAKLNENIEWAINIPFLASVHEWEFEFDNFKLMGQIVPTAHIILTGKSGFQLSPYLGYGGGAVFHIDNEWWAEDNNFDQIRTFRFGIDAMFSKQMGVSLAYMNTAIKYKFDAIYRDYDPDLHEYTYLTKKIDESYNYWQMVLSIVFHP